LLAGGGVLGIEYARAPEPVESRFHNVICMNEKTVRIRLRFCTRVVAKFQRVLAIGGELFFNAPIY
jgi:hypothetical protein